MKQIHVAWRACIDDADAPLADAVETYAEQLRMIGRAGAEFVLLEADRENGISPGAVAANLVPQVSGIGVVPRVQMAKYAPYSMARFAASLDQMSEGRGGWMVGIDPDREDPVAVAEEYLEVCRKLWASWESGAVLEDVRTGVFADASKVHTIDHRGEYFAVKGPLNTIPSRGAPLVVQCPGSEAEQDLAGRTADCVVIDRASLTEVAAVGRRVREAARDRAHGGAPVLLLGVELHTDEGLAEVAVAASARGGFSLRGPAERLAVEVVALTQRTGVNGVVIDGRWESTPTTLTCMNVLGRLRQWGYVARQSTPAAGLRESVTGAHRR